MTQNKALGDLKALKSFMIDLDIDADEEDRIWVDEKFQSIAKALQETPEPINVEGIHHRNLMREYKVLENSCKEQRQELDEKDREIRLLNLTNSRLQNLRTPLPHIDLDSLRKPVPELVKNRNTDAEWIAVNIHNNAIDDVKKLMEKKDA